MGYLIVLALVVAQHARRVAQEQNQKPHSKSEVSASPETAVCNPQNPEFAENSSFDPKTTQHNGITHGQMSATNHVVGKRRSERSAPQAFNADPSDSTVPFQAWPTV